MFLCIEYRTNTNTVSFILLHVPSVTAGASCGSFWINFLGSFFYLVSSIFSVLECFENKKLRAEEGLPPLELFSFDMHVIDWFGWGDWLYLIISVVALLQCYLYSYVVYTDDFIAPYYLTSKFVLHVSTVAYQKTKASVQ